MDKELEIGVTNVDQKENFQTFSRRKENSKLSSICMVCYRRLDPKQN
jgi:hypothetical protein